MTKFHWGCVGTMQAYVYSIVRLSLWICLNFGIHFVSFPENSLMPLEVKHGDEYMYRLQNTGICHCENPRSSVIYAALETPLNGSGWNRLMPVHSDRIRAS
jgi:hypothetical protein